MKQILILLCIAGLSSCTNNQMAKQFGGTITVNIPQGNKLINATWKNDDLWYFTKAMNSNDIPETYYFTEESSYGMIQGTVIFKESK